MGEIRINGWIEKGWNNSSAKTRKNFGQKKSVKNAVKVGPFSRKCPKNGHFFNNFLNFTPYILFLSNDFRLNRLVRICRFQKYIIHMRTIHTSEITVTPENQYWPPPPLKSIIIRASWNRKRVFTARAGELLRNGYDQVCFWRVKLINLIQATGPRWTRTLETGKLPTVRENRATRTRPAWKSKATSNSWSLWKPPLRSPETIQCRKRKGGQ